MKKIRILAVLVIIVFIGDMVSDGTSAFMDGWNEARDSTEYRFSDVDISVKPDKTLVVDSLFNTTIQQKVPYRITSLETKIDSTFWRVTFKVLIFPFALFGLYGFYCMMRVVISVSRGKVFTRENANRMRIFVYALILVGLCMEVEHYIQYRDAVPQIQLSGYVTAPYTLHFSWFSYMILALFTEIFAVGVKMKEEQDLTI